MATFQDNFTGERGWLPSSIWTPYPWAPGTAVPNSGKVALDGKGHIELRIDNSQQSAAIWTKDRVRFAPPFHMRARVKFPTSYEVWHAWWWANGNGEVDAYENGGLLTRVQSSTHEWDENSVHIGADVTKCPIDFNPTADYHVYEAKVTPSRVEFLIDGRTTAIHEVDPKFFSAHGWFVLNLWASPNFTSKGYPASLLVEKIEVLSL